MELDAGVEMRGGGATECRTCRASCAMLRRSDMIPSDFGNCWYRHVSFAAAGLRPAPRKQLCLQEAQVLSP